jgi:hypothetical protein
MAKALVRSLENSRIIGYDLNGIAKWIEDAAER